MSIPPLIHVGFHKTGSTLLQQRLFHDDFGFSVLREDRRRIPRIFVQPGPLETLDPEQVEELATAHAAAEADGRCLVISHERLSGYPASGGYDAPIVARRLYSAFPNARVLIMIREQRKMLRSFYLQYISDGGNLSFSRLVTPMEPELRRMPGFDFRFYEYHRAVEHYRELFGAENVLVLPFEMLGSDGIGLARRVVEFAGGKPSRDLPGDIFSETVNAARPMLMQAAARRLNGIIGRNQLAPGAVAKIPYFAREFRRVRPLFAPFALFDPLLDRRLRKRIGQAVGDRYSQSNGRLAAMTGLDLANFGYDLPDNCSANVDGQGQPTPSA